MKRSFMMNKKYSLNASAIQETSFDMCSKNLDDFSSDVLNQSSSTLSELSITSNQYSQNEMQLTKKKMGVQLSILEKNIFFQPKKSLKERTSKINRTSYLNTDKQIRRKSITMSKEPVLPQPKHISNLGTKQNQNTVTELQPITATDLQQIRKFDKDIYQLYLDLYHDYMHELQIKREKNNVVEQLQSQIQEKEKQEKQINQQIQAVLLRQQQLQQIQGANQNQFITKLRTKMLQNL